MWFLVYVGRVYECYILYIIFFIDVLYNLLKILIVILEMKLKMFKGKCMMMDENGFWYMVVDIESVLIDCIIVKYNGWLYKRIKGLWF